MRILVHGAWKGKPEPNGHAETFHAADSGGHLSDAAWGQFLERICPLPDPIESEEERQRHEHADLSGLTLRELERERSRVHLRLVLEDTPAPWLQERLAIVERGIRDGRAG
jgi:hypothetical protein